MCVLCVCVCVCVLQASQRRCHVRFLPRAAHSLHYHGAVPRHTKRQTLPQITWYAVAHSIADSVPGNRPRLQPHPLKASHSHTQPHETSSNRRRRPITHHLNRQGREHVRCIGVGHVKGRHRIDARGVQPAGRRRRAPPLRAPEPPRRPRQGTTNRRRPACPVQQSYHGRSNPIRG